MVSQTGPGDAMTLTTARLFLALWLGLAAAGSLAADVGIATIVEGDARVLRAVTWYKLIPGARVEAGDIIAAAEKATVQVEFPAGSTLNLGGPSELFAARPYAPDKTADSQEFALARGWMKFVTRTAGSSARVRAALAVIEMTEAIAVIHTEPSAAEVFVESGAARIAATDAGKDGVPQDVKAGEFWARNVRRPPRTDGRAPLAFVAAMPRDMVDALPSLAGRFPKAPAALTAQGEVTFAEAEPWLSGPYRKIFVKRFEPRLKDREFRAAVESRIASFPEWDRLLHPEKYAPKESPPPK